jgi:NAD(P)-dependent dehydrogenase (short-subunit alcohol dehydrogenase family)
MKELPTADVAFGAEKVPADGRKIGGTTMTVTDTGTVLITGPTRGPGRALALELAGRAEPERPDLLLVGRPGGDIDAGRRRVPHGGATVHEIPCDLSRLADVRAAAATAQDPLATGAVRQLRALVANAGLSVTDTRVTSADGYEMTFAVNYLAHAQLIGDLLGSFTPPARIAGSGPRRGRHSPRSTGGNSERRAAAVRPDRHAM